MLEAFREYTQRKNLSLGHGLIGGRTVGEHTGQRGHLSQPTAVTFAFAFKREVQGSLLGWLRASRVAARAGRALGAPGKRAPEGAL